MSLRYSLFGIPATLDEYFDRAHRDRQTDLLMGLETTRTTLLVDDVPVELERLGYKIIFLYSNGKNKFIARENIRENLNHNEQIADFISLIPSHIKDLVKLAKENGFDTTYSKESLLEVLTNTLEVRLREPKVSEEEAYNPATSIAALAASLK